MSKEVLFCPCCGQQHVQADGSAFVEIGEYDSHRGVYEEEWDGDKYECADCGTVFIVGW